jgi:hypothetical protein
MFSRAVAFVTTSKSAMNEKVVPAKQVGIAVPSGARGFTASATLTSCAVQVLPFRCFAMVASTSAKQVPAANAGEGRKTTTASASSAKTNESFLQQHVIELIAFLLLRRNRALVGCCLGVTFSF